MEPYKSRIDGPAALYAPRIGRIGSHDVGLNLLDVDHREEEPTEGGAGRAHQNQQGISHGLMSPPDDLGPLDTAVIDGHEQREACPLCLLRAGLRRQVEERQHGDHADTAECHVNGDGGERPCRGDRER